MRGKASSHAVTFAKVLECEREAVNERRRRLGRPILPQPKSGEGGVTDAVGLALSGGGVRSAAFCLGVLQALDAHDTEHVVPGGGRKATALDHVDWLSTVSGGGYIGGAMTAGMSASADKAFPFESRLDFAEAPALQHVRDNSNYLLPSGVQDIFTSVAIYLRGLLASILQVLPWLLVFAAVTIFLNPKLGSAGRSLIALSPLNLFGLKIFISTVYLLILFAGFLILWGIVRSRRAFVGTADVGTVWVRIGAWLVGILAFVAFCEVQTLVLKFLIVDSSTGLPREGLSSAVKSFATVLTGVAAVIGFLAQKIADVLAMAGETASRWKAFVMKIGAKAAILVAAGAVPIIFWIAYLALCLWGIPVRGPDGVDEMSAPAFVSAAARLFSFSDVPVAWLFLLTAAVLFVVNAASSPNANSLHRLYRDRISRAFLVKPDEHVAPNAPLPSLDAFKLSELDASAAPYHLVNAALNIHGSRYANRRGRNADFFTFSRDHVGSEATGYAPTATMERQMPGLDLATAIAVSGAAASSNMGSQSIRLMSPTLAFLNVRLGYWMRSPTAGTGKALFLLRFVRSFYFLFEMFGFLDPRSWLVYLTDGGHIENLGIYSLLRRRCRVIIVVDAEADPAIACGALVKLQRYARIDLGVRMWIPWQAIRDANAATSQAVAATGGEGEGKGRKGPHCALGRIQYDGIGEGLLLYVKSSLTGDENDYIIDYKRRFPDYPHEATIDQLFSEEQFEVYRALGFHAVNGFLSGKDEVAVEGVPPEKAPDANARGAGQVPSSEPPLPDQVRQALGLG
jgi:predicted acylesterase/phospholipase RssA